MIYTPRRNEVMMLFLCLHAALLGSALSRGLKSKHKLLRPETHAADSTGTVNSFAAKSEVTRDAAFHMSKGPLVQRLRSENFGNVYTGEMSIGGSPQKVIFDTGSFELVVMSKCRSASALQMRKESLLRTSPSPPPRDPRDMEGWNSESCKKHHQATKEVAHHSHVRLRNTSVMCCDPEYCPHATYDPTHSDTFSTPEAAPLRLIVYGSGPVVARPGFDEVEIQRGSLIPSSFSEEAIKEEVPLQVIVNHSIPFLEERGTFTAIVGIAPGNVLDTKGRWLNRLGIERYTFCFPKDRVEDGYVTWNDVDHSSDASWNSIEVDGLVHWAFNTHKFSLVDFGAYGPEHTEVDVGCKDGCGILVDTGSSFITLPQPMLKRLVEGLADRVADCSDLSVFPSLSFNIGGRDLVLPPDAYLANAGQLMSHNLGTSIGPRKLLTLPLTKEDAKLAQQAASNGTSVLVGSCVVLLTTLPCPTPTQWGPLIIVGMPLFRTYSVQFDLSREPKRFLHVSESEGTCGMFHSSQLPGHHDGESFKVKAPARHKPSLQKVSIDALETLPRSVASVEASGEQMF